MRQSDDLNTAFDRALLKRVHADVRQAFPQIRNLTDAAGVTTHRTGHHFVEITVPRLPRYVWEGRAYDRYEARAKAWQAFMRKNGVVGYYDMERTA